MIFPSFLRKSLHAAHALGQFWLTVFLLSSTLCFLVNPYTIDNSCHNYKGNNITGDVQQAIIETQNMARNALVKILASNPITNKLNISLFGMNRLNNLIVSRYFAAFSRRILTENFVVICGDGMVNVDTRGKWIDYVHGWTYDNFVPCDSDRQLNTPKIGVNGFTVNKRLIYLCPKTLDQPKGRNLAIYKDQVLAGESIDRYMLLPAILFHELLHTSITSLTDEQVRSFPPIEVIRDPTRHHLFRDPVYLSSLPIMNAYGFVMCRKLAADSPNRAVQNADSVVLCALGLYLDKNDWCSRGFQGIGVSLPPGGD